MEKTILLKGCSKEAVLESICDELDIKIKSRQKSNIMVIKEKLKDFFQANSDTIYKLEWDPTNCYNYFIESYLGEMKWEYIKNNPKSNEPIPELGNMFRDAVYDALSSGFNRNDYIDDAEKNALLKVRALSISISYLSEQIGINLNILEISKE